MRNDYSALRRKIVLDHLEKFPDTPARTIARIIARDNLQLFKDVEDARSLIRLYRGQSGGANRIDVKQRKYYTHEI